MVITVSCPACAASFPVDPNKIPEGGVKVRCSQCSHVFRVERPADESTREEVVAPPEVAGPEESTSTSLVPGSSPGDEASGSEGGSGGASQSPGVAEAEDEPDLGDIPSDMPADLGEPGATGESHGSEQGAEAAGWAVEYEEFHIELEVEEPQAVGEGQAEADVPADGGSGFGGWPELDVTLTGAEASLDEPEESMGGVEAAFTAREEPEVEIEEAFEAVEEPEVEIEEVFEVVAEVEVEVEPAFEPSREEAPEPPSLPEAAPVQGFTFGRRDPVDKARRLARVLVSDMVMYNAERHQLALSRGTLQQDFDEEIRKSWKEFVDQVGAEMAEGEGRTFWTQALNEILAKGKDVF